MGKRRGLGRGLEALMSGADPIAPPGGAARVPVDTIHANPHQPRRQFDEAELQALADSIREHGILQPLVVVRAGAGYRLVAGERRLRAARLAGLDEVPVVVRDAGEGEESLSLSLVENVQRFDLNPLEEAEAVRRLVDEFGLTHEAVARRLGRSRTQVTNALRLLDLAEAVRSALRAGAITAGHARALAGIPDHPTQEEALRFVVRDQLNVRQTEALVEQLAAGAGRPRRPRATRAADPETRALEDRFRDALQAKVKLTRRGERGRLVVEFFSADELDALYRRVVGEA